MELDDFLKEFADQFDETDPSEITPETDFHELDEWGSLTAMSVIAFVRTKYGKKITGKDIRNCKTVKDLFEIVNIK